MLVKKWQSGRQLVGFPKETYGVHGWENERWEIIVGLAGLEKVEGSGTCGDLD